MGKQSKRVNSVGQKTKSAQQHGGERATKRRSCGCVAYLGERGGGGGGKEQEGRRKDLRRAVQLNGATNASQWAKRAWRDRNLKPGKEVEVLSWRLLMRLCFPYPVTLAQTTTRRGGPQAQVLKWTEVGRRYRTGLIQTSQSEGSVHCVRPGEHEAYTLYVHAALCRGIHRAKWPGGTPSDSSGRTLLCLHTHILNFYAASQSKAQVKWPGKIKENKFSVISRSKPSQSKGR